MRKPPFQIVLCKEHAPAMRGVIIEIETHVIQATTIMLEKFSHRDLKGYAEAIGVRIGKCKNETIENLMASGKATVLAQLGS